MPSSARATSGRRSESYRYWWVVLAAWAGMGLLWSAQLAVSRRLAGEPTPFAIAVAIQMPLALLWAGITPGIVWLGRRVPAFGTRRWPLGVAVHLATSVVVVFGTGVVLILNSRWVQGLSPNAAPLLLASLRSLVFWFSSDGLLYWAILAIDYGARYSRDSRERELRASQLEAQLSEARLQALKTQLHPHFLFNALHTVGQLIRTGQDALAVQVTAGLGDLLRRVLDEAATQEVPLKQELELLRVYIAIEAIRFSDRLQVVVHADPDVLDARVPHLILQPLVENAIKHGIARRAAVGHVLIGARRINGSLYLVVRDDGSGMPVTAADQGVGLTNTRARLRQLYGTAASVEVVNMPDGGVAAQIVVPYRVAAAEWRGEG